MLAVTSRKVCFRESNRSGTSLSVSNDDLKLVRRRPGFDTGHGLDLREPATVRGGDGSRVRLGLLLMLCSAVAVVVIAVAAAWI